MTTEQIKQQLCYRDKRNPNYFEHKQKILKCRCNCSNCESGRHELANELLRVKDLLTSAVEPIR